MTEKIRIFGKSYTPTELAFIGGGIFLAYAVYKGGVSNAVRSIGLETGKAIVNAAGGVVTGGVDAVGQNVGLPPVDENTTDAYVSRYIIDHYRGGTFAASVNSSAMAFARALLLPEGSGYPPPEGTVLRQKFPPAVIRMGEVEVVNPEGDW